MVYLVPTKVFLSIRRVCRLAEPLRVSSSTSNGRIIVNLTNCRKRKVIMSRISRRALARIASAAVAAKGLSAQHTGHEDYAGPLTGLQNKAEGRGLDPLPYAVRLLDSAPRRLRFSARNRREAEQWQGQLRSKLTELLGGFPTERAPLRPITLETKEFSGYRSEKVIFDSRDGMSVLAYILTPKNARTPVPAVICVPGHGRGVDDIVGIDDKGQRSDRQGRLPARFRNPGGRSRHGGGGDRAAWLRLPARSR